MPQRGEASCVLTKSLQSSAGRLFLLRSMHGHLGLFGCRRLDRARARGRCERGHGRSVGARGRARSRCAYRVALAAPLSPRVSRAQALASMGSGKALKRRGRTDTTLHQPSVEETAGSTSGARARWPGTGALTVAAVQPCRACSIPRETSFKRDVRGRAGPCERIALSRSACFANRGSRFEFARFHCASAGETRWLAICVVFVRRG